MSPLALLLTFSLGMGFVVQQCDLTGFNIGDISNTVTISNTSPDETADTVVVLGDGSSFVDVPPGESRSVDTILGAYTVSVVPTANRDSDLEYLKQLRDTLDQHLLDPSLSPMESLTLLTQLQQFTEALKAAAQGPGAPSCTGTIEGSAKVTHVSLTWTATSPATGSWSLHCG